MTRPVLPSSNTKFVDSDFHDLSIPQGFWQQRWVQRMLPLGSSLAFHLAIVVVGLIAYKAVQQVVSKEVPQTVIAAGDIFKADPAEMHNPGLNRDPSHFLTQSEFPEVPPVTGMATKLDSSTNALAGVASPSVIGSSPLVGLPHEMEGTPGGHLARFGPGGGGGNDPFPNSIGPIKDNIGGRHVMYLCDASGSMMSVFGELKVELRNSIHQLKPVQTFNIVFFSDEGYQALSKTGMILATPDNVRKADEFINDAVATGGTQPLPAIKFALGQHADLVWLLTDGFDQVASFDDVLGAFRVNNADRCRINCIYLQADEDPKLVQVLKTISQEHHGMMKTILKSDF